MSKLDIFALILSVATVILPHTWRFLTHAITLVHELGHALVGLLTGAQVSSIKINKDSSGVTTSAHPLKNIVFTRALTTFWGYPFPPLFAGILLFIGQSVGLSWAWWAVFGLGIICLVFIRNLFGLMITLTWIGFSAVFLWLEVAVEISAAFMFLLVGALFFGGIRDFLNLTRLYLSRRDESSDIQALRATTHIPAVVWLFFMWLTGCFVIPYALWWALLR